MCDPRFYLCEICGNVFEIIHDSGNQPVCCGTPMKEMMPGTTDGKTEWHVPVCKVTELKVVVHVGENPHPMEKDHYIEWIELVTDRGLVRKYLEPGDDPVANFKLCNDEKILEVYAYCNKHRLWKSNCVK